MPSIIPLIHLCFPNCENSVISSFLPRNIGSHLNFTDLTSFCEKEYFSCREGGGSLHTQPKVALDVSLKIRKNTLKEKRY